MSNNKKLGVIHTPNGMNFNRSIGVEQRTCKLEQYGENLYLVIYESEWVSDNQQKRIGHYESVAVEKYMLGKAESITDWKFMEFATKYDPYTTKGCAMLLWLSENQNGTGNILHIIQYHGKKSWHHDNHDNWHDWDYDIKKEEIPIIGGVHIIGPNQISWVSAKDGATHIIDMRYKAVKKQGYRGSYTTDVFTVQNISLKFDSFDFFETLGIYDIGFDDDSNFYIYFNYREAGDIFIKYNMLPEQINGRFYFAPVEIIAPGDTTDLTRQIVYGLKNIKNKERQSSKTWDYSANEAQEMWRDLLEKLNTLIADSTAISNKSKIVKIAINHTKWTGHFDPETNNLYYYGDDSECRRNQAKAFEWYKEQLDNGNLEILCDKSSQEYSALLRFLSFPTYDEAIKASHQRT